METRLYSHMNKDPDSTIPFDIPAWASQGLDMGQRDSMPLLYHRVRPCCVSLQCFGRPRQYLFKSNRLRRVIHMVDLILDPSSCLTM